MMRASDDFLNAVLPTRDPGAVSTGVLAQAIRGPKRSETARWIGILSDALAGAAGMPGQYAKAVQQNRQFEMEQERNTLLNDLTRAQAEKARQPAGAERRYFEANNGDQYVLENDVPRRLFADPTPKIDYIQARDPVTGAVSLIPRVMGAQSAPTGDLPQGFTVRPKGGAGSGPRTFR